MRIYFENYRYPDKQSIFPYFQDRDTGKHTIPVQYDNGKQGEGWYVEHIGYLFVSSEYEGIKYSGPVFILPKSFLHKCSKSFEQKETLLGMSGLYPENIIDTEDNNNPLVAQGLETFLPELSLWLFRAMTRYKEEAFRENDKEALNDLDYLTPNDSARDRDFLSTAVRLMDFLSDHRNLFTQITKINHSGRAAVDWHKTITQTPFLHKGKPWYLDLCIKDKAVNIDEELIVLYYSVLRYLKDKYHFPIDLGEVMYPLKTTSEIQRYLDTGVGKRRMRDMKSKYYRDDLRNLWTLLDNFFTFNTSKDDKNPVRECLVVKNFELVFEKMVDHLIGDTGKLGDLRKEQKDGKLIDHIYLDKSLIGKDTSIYYIGDSKYYETGSHPKGVALYKQFTYARNVIQYNIEQFYLKTNKNPYNIRYRDKKTEGYNVTPNFFIVPKIEENDLQYDKPSFEPSDWIPEPNKQFENRLFDRDTLLLREYQINLLFLIAAYGAYEDWTKPLREKIREDMVGLLNTLYAFYTIEPIDIPIYSRDKLVDTWFFEDYFRTSIQGKAYKVAEDANEIILAFERDPKPVADDYKAVRDNIQYAIKGGSIDNPVELEP